MNAFPFICTSNQIHRNQIRFELHIIYEINSICRRLSSLAITICTRRGRIVRSIGGIACITNIKSFPYRKCIAFYCFDGVHFVYFNFFVVCLVSITQLNSYTTKRGINKNANELSALDIVADRSNNRRK